MIGSSLGSYEILEEIGRGGMGAVYKARQPSLDRIVAVKVLLPQLAADGIFVERFLREARSIATLEHQGIVTVYDVGEADGTYYFAMQLLEGRPLDEILEDGKSLPVDTAIQITKQVARALQYAHDASILHRDVKPGNIIVTDSGGAVLTDFGIAKALSDTTSLTKTGTSIGSPEYMAPEQIEGKELDARADLYALGVVLYQMLVGEVPYQGDSAVSIVYQHVKSPVPSAREANPKVPELVDQVVSTLMAKEPDERFASAGALLAGLDGKEFARGIDKPAPKAEEASGLPKWVWGAAAALAALVVILIFALGGGSPEETAESAAGEAQLAATAEEAAPVEPDGVESGEATEVAEPAAPAPPPAPSPRRLSITSAPAGATVVLNGETLDRQTPTEADFLPDTPYELQLRLDGHESAGWTFGLGDLSAEQQSSDTLHFPLRSSIPPGTLTIAADYPVTVRIAGGRHTSKRISLPPNDYTATISAPSVFHSETRRVKIKSGENQTVTLPVAVSIKLSANPSRCRVRINGMDAGHLPTEVRLTVGQHEFEFDWEGLGKKQSLTRRITPRSDRVFAAAPR